MSKPGGPKGKPVRQGAVETLTAQIKASPVMFVTDFTGLNVLKMRNSAVACERRGQSTSW